MLRYILKMVNGFFLNTGSVEARLSLALVIPLEEVSIYNNLLFVFTPQGKKISNSVRNIWYKGCFCHTQEFVMGTILSLCNCSLEIVLFLIKAT